MSEVKWIAHNIEIIKKDIRSARELRESQKFYMSMDLEQDLMDAYDLTLLLRQCFGPSFDPSIIFFKFNVKTQTIYILRENEEYFNTYNKELEKYNNQLSADLDFESYGDEKEFFMFMKKNIEWLIDLSYSLEKLSQKNTHSLEYFKKIENIIYELSPEFICLLQLFGTNGRAYKIYQEKYNSLKLHRSWDNQDHAFFKVVNDMKIITKLYEPLIKNQLIMHIIAEFKNSPPYALYEDDALKNLWEQIGYLSNLINFESTLSDVENKVLEYFQKLEPEKQLLLHYHVFEYEFCDMRIDDNFLDITDYTYEDLYTYLRQIAQGITSQAYSEWSSKIE